MNMLHICKSKRYNVIFSYIYNKQIVNLRIPLMSVTVTIIALTFWIALLVKLSGDVHPNLGPSSREGSSSSHISDLYNF